MANDEAGMTNEKAMTNDEKAKKRRSPFGRYEPRRRQILPSSLSFRHSFVIRCFVIRHFGRLLVAPTNLAGRCRR